MHKLVVFDLDGTLNQTNLYAVEAHKLALKELCVEPMLTDEEIVSHFGARPADYVKGMLPNHSAQEHELYLKKVTNYENQLLETYGKPFDGVTSSLSALKEEGYEIAICSNSSERYITMVLKRLSLFDYVDYIQQLLPNMIKDDTLKILLEKVSPDKAVMVGDRIYDKNAAMTNNIPFIGCAYGYNASEVEDSDCTVYHAKDLHKAVVTLIG